jgi:CRISPR-associated endonuclease/helicase Cas3
VYDQHFDALYRAGDLELLDGEIAVLVDLDLYSEATGLSLEADCGKGLFV